MWSDTFYQFRLQAWSSGLRQRMAVPLRIELWNGQRIDLDPRGVAPRVVIHVPQPSSLRHLLSPSLYSLGRAYVEGAIDVSGRAGDMIAVVNALAASRGPARRASWLSTLPGRMPWLTSLPGRHTRQRDLDAIAYHYDVSNEFYAAWLDPAMVYSCAYFDTGTETLAAAQQAKIDHVLRKIDLRPGQRLLDIGCGWGALVIQAARKYGARCVGITLSENQARLARERVAQAGLSGQVEIRLEDYRDTSGSYERITSVDMFEHVGLKHLPEYFRRIRELLTEDGVAMNHGLTSTDVRQRGVPYGGGQFIQRYVFPHGELAHLGTVLQAMQEGGLEARDVENLRRHYARTCQLWADNFENNAERIRKLTDEKRFRIWHVYLAGCAHAFQHDWISIYQVVCGKAGRDPAALPWSRAYMYARQPPQPPQPSQPAEEGAAHCLAFGSSDP